MTNRGLRRRLLWVASAVVYTITLSLIEYVNKNSSTVTFIGSHATLFALLFAAYLGYIFQQRAKFVDDIRKWWTEIVQAKSEFYIYCDKENPTQDDYLKAFYKLSTAMDTLRLIYCNVERTDANPGGYFPFEQVRDIIDIARSVSINRGKSSLDRKRAKSAIDIIFQSLRHSIQSEASAITPDDPLLFNSAHRVKYLKKVLQRTNVNVVSIRDENKKD